MRKKTPEEEKMMNAALNKMKTPVQGATEDETPIIAVPLKIMLGETEEIGIGPKYYTLGPFILGNLEKSYQLLAEVPALLIVMALTGKDGEAINIADMVPMYNRMMGRTVDPDTASIDDKPETIMATEAEVHSYLLNLPRIITHEIILKMLDPMLLALRRHHEDLTEDDLLPYVDIPMFVSFVRALFRVNTGLRETF